MKKVISCVIVVSMIIFTFSFSSFAAVQTNPIKVKIAEPVPNGHTAYLIISAQNTAKLFEFSSQIPIEQLYINARFTGSRWEVQTYIIDGLSADITVKRFNANTLEYEASFLITSGTTMKTTGIYTTSNYTNYISYGIPVENNSSLGQAYIIFPTLDEVQTDINNNILELETTLENIETILSNYTEDSSDKLNQLIDHANDLNDYLDAMVGILSAMYTSVENNTSSVYAMYSAFLDYMNYIQPKLNSMDIKITSINTSLNTIKSTTTTISNNIKNSIMPDLQTIIDKLEIIINLLDKESPTYPSENQSGLDEYNSMESELMIDNSAEIDKIFQDSKVVINPSAIAFINNMLQNTVFSIPEMSAIIILLLALGIAVLILGRRV